eukprot:CAMPEP_0184873582 /NCGR_PEP_ID=MMETSP0580-20130426/41926_1 /TAXON_ID=1118495 /ORGANISM="Dactyliosolen fragilissimus" /LENGTH=262 /DNA_ID=CAMNT_0027376507 /DNA_START=470 /DNA_END=1258 /DNA_ORIENTATION=+
MSDDKLRSALVYRIDTSSESPVVTMLAKYDHASDYEAHAGSASESLYGSRDKDYADAVGMVINNDPPMTGIVESGTIGDFKIVQSDVHQVAYGTDPEGLCLAVITGLRYPSRVATQMLVELYAEYSETFGLQAKSATAGSLIKKSKPYLAKYCAKFDDLESVDKASSLRGKVDEVKVQMQDNIATMLHNIDKAETIQDQADQLNEQATVFKKKSTDLRKQMRCKNLKMTIILVLLIGGILAVILIPLIIRAKNAIDKKDDNP